MEEASKASKEDTLRTKLDIGLYHTFEVGGDPKYR